MKRLTVSMPEEMWEALTAEAERMGGCDRSAVIRRAVRLYFARQAGNDAETILEQVRMVAEQMVNGNGSNTKMVR